MFGFLVQCMNHRLYFRLHARQHVCLLYGCGGNTVALTTRIRSRRRRRSRDSVSIIPHSQHISRDLRDVQNLPAFNAVMLNDF